MLHITYICTLTHTHTLLSVLLLDYELSASNDAKVLVPV